mgnify:CR=1 FL=1
MTISEAETKIHPSDLATCDCGRTIYWCTCE